MQSLPISKDNAISVIVAVTSNRHSPGRIANRKITRIHERNHSSTLCCESSSETVLIQSRTRWGGNMRKILASDVVLGIPTTNKIQYHTSEMHCRVLQQAKLALRSSHSWVAVTDTETFLLAERETMQALQCCHLIERQWLYKNSGLAEPEKICQDICQHCV